MKLSLPDWIIIAVYMAGMIAVGLWAMTKIKDCGGFLLGKRKMGKLMMIASSFGTGISSNHPISVASATYSNGFSGIWLSLGFLFVTPFYWLFPPVFRRARIVTMVDFVRLRYGRVMEIAYNLLTLVGGSIAIGMGVKTASSVIHVMSGGAITEFWAQAIIVGLILAYSVPGGIIAAYATDVIQGLLIVVLSFLLIPFMAREVGGFTGLHEQVPERFFALVSSEGYSVYWIFWFVFGTVFSASGWGTNAASGGARNELAARLTVCGSLAKRICTVGWMLVGVFGIAMYAGTLDNPDDVFAQMCADVLPVGLRGLMVASILAAVMSSVDAGMIFTASIFTNNVYQEFWVKNASPRHYLSVARISGVIAVLLGWYVATSIKSLVDIVLICEQFGALVGVSIFGALVWRRATRTGAIASILVMVPLFWYGSIYRQDDWTMVQWVPLYLIPGLITFVGVSLVTRQHNARHVAELYARLDTPLGEEHRLAEQGVEVDLLEELDGETITVSEQDHDISKRLWLLDFITWPAKVARGEAKLSDYWIDFAGFFGIVAFALLFTAGVYWLAQVGA
jgi:Na+/proline symporter